jgi:hypothetical protein
MVNQYAHFVTLITSLTWLINIHTFFKKINIHTFFTGQWSLSSPIRTEPTRYVTKDFQNKGANKLQTHNRRFELGVEHAEHDKLNFT